MKAAAIFEKLWDVINDHVAFRTFNDARVNINILAKNLY